MLYYFTWNSPKLIDDNLNAWKNQFIKKYWDFNFTKITSIEEIEKNHMVELLSANSFLSEKKLVIIQLTKNKKEDEAVNFILWYLDKIPEDNIIIFYEDNPDKRSKKYKTLKKEATVKEFSIKDTYSLENYIEKKYPNCIAKDAIQEIVRYKAENLAKIEQEIDKLLITKDYIEKKDIIENIFPELDESIFQIIDCVLNKNSKLLIDTMNNLLTQVNIYLFYNMLVSNLRTNLYILKYKQLWIPVSQISNKLKLGNRWFLITKQYKINYNELKKIYVNLVDLDKNMKTWKLLFSENDYLKEKIEEILVF